MQAFLGDYRLIATLGRGGMAEVFLAVRSGMVGFHKLVVIKRLRADLVAQPQAARYRTLMLDEARLAARLNHPNIVQTFEVGDQQGAPFLAMEYLDGQPLSRVLAQARRMAVPLPIELALQIVGGVLSGLGYAHDLADYDGMPLDIVHRDVGPQNTFWTYEGDIKLVDFGVAKFALNTDETEAGVVKGKLTYMAPEQARGQAIDRRADLFVTGILLWELITGRRLLRAPSQAASLERLLFEELPSPARIIPDLDPAIARICERALQRDRERRYQTAGEMRADLEQIAVARPPRREDLSGFIQPLFRDERAVMAQHIRDALAGDGELLSLSTPELLTSRSNAVASAPGSTSLPAVHGDADRTTPSRQPNESVAEPGRSMSFPTSPAAPTAAMPPLSPPLPAQRHRRWAIGAGVGLGAIVAVVVGVAVSRSPGAPAVATRSAPPPPFASPVPAGAAAAGRVAAPAAPRAERMPDLRLCGSNTIGAELGPALVEAFLKRKGAQTVAREVEPEHAKLTAQLGGQTLVIDVRAAGSATAFEGLLAGTCDLGMASRPINDKEIKKLADAGLGDLSSPATEHVIGLDGIAVIVHPNNKLAALDKGQLHDIFTGKVTDWREVGGAPGPITLLARDNKSGTFDTFKALVLGADPLLASARRLAESDVLADAVASDPTAIGFIGLAYVRSAKALQVGDAGASPKLPTSFTVTTEEYMLSRRLFMYSTPTPRTPLVTELVSYVLSPQGQAVVRDTNFIDLSVALRDGDPCDLRCPRTYAALVAHAQRISLDFRFRVGSGEVDSRANRDLDRVVQFLRGYPNAKLMLLGFSDAAGVPLANLRLSQQRAATIAKELAVRGIHAALVDGFGAAMPVASNATEADRQRNRRVEAWLELPH